MIPDDVVDRVREEADIVGIVGEFVKLKRSGSSFRGPCPFHQGKHDNFAVTARGGYVCFVCGEKGDVFTFVQKRLGLDFVESVKWVGAKAGIEVHETFRRTEERDPREAFWEVNAAAAEYFASQLWSDDAGKVAREYLSSRGLGQEEATRFQIGYAPRDPVAMRDHLSTLGYDQPRQLAAGLLVAREDRPEPRSRFRHRLMFPIADAAGHLVGFGGRALGDVEPKYLNSPESEVFSKGQLLYGMQWAKHAIRKADRVLVVEGYFDAIRLVLAGIDEVVAPLGTALTDPQAALIRRYTKTANLLYDSDRAGLKATFRAGDALLAHGVTVRVVTLPTGEDPDSYAAKAGAAGVERAIAAAVDIFDRKIQLLERGGWFADLQRKREAIDKLLPTIRVTADAVMRDLYIARTAEVAGVSREMLERELAAPVAGRRRGEPAPPAPPPAERAPARVRAGDDRRAIRRQSHLAERELVRMLIHQRRFLEAAAERIGGETFANSLYRDIFTRLTEVGPDATPEELAMELEPEAVELLQELLEESGGIDRAEEVITGSINKLLAGRLDERVAAIDGELLVAAPEEKAALDQEKQRLLREIRALGRSRWKGFNSPRT